MLSALNANGSGQQSDEHSVYTGSTTSETAYDGGEQASPILMNSSRCTTCSQINFEEKPEKDLNKPLHGWPALAKEMERYPDFEAFPTFRDLNIKSLLYYQAELDDFRHRLQLREWKDHRENAFEDADTLNQNIKALLKGKGTGDRRETQLNLITDMRKVLKEYNDALLQYSQINALPEPDNLNVNSLRTWLINSNRDIVGRGAATWGHLAHEDDTTTLGQQFGILLKSIFWPSKFVATEHKLVVPQKAKEVDGLTQWIAHEWVPFWDKVRKTKFWKSPPWNRPWRHQKQINSQLPGGTLYNEKSASSITSSVKRWNQMFHQSKRDEDLREDTDQSPELNAKVAPTTTMNTYAMSRMLRFTSLVATLIACLLPIVGITVLSKIHTQPKILGFMALFTALFAIGLMWVTPPGTSRTEIFTATAAFSAVLVVFVQNQNGNTNGS